MEASQRWNWDGGHPGRRGTPSRRWARLLWDKRRSDYGSGDRKEQNWRKQANEEGVVLKSEESNFVHRDLKLVDIIGWCDDIDWTEVWSNHESEVESPWEALVVGLMWIWSVQDECKELWVNHLCQMSLKRSVWAWKEGKFLTVDMCMHARECDKLFSIKQNVTNTERCNDGEWVVRRVQLKYRRRFEHIEFVEVREE